MLVFFSYGGFAQEGKLNASVKGLIHLKTEERKAEVSITYSIKEPANDTTFQFLFSKKNILSSIRGKNLDKYWLDTSSGRVPSLKFKLNSPTKGGSYDMKLTYSVPLDSSTLTIGFAELGLDWFWIPYHPSYNNWNLVFDLKIKIDRAEYRLFSNGGIKKSKKNTYHVTSKLPDFDINLFIIKDPSVHVSKNREIQVVSKMDNDLLQDSIATEVRAALQYYKTLYGEAPNSLTAIFRPIIKGGTDWGYNRKGYFVLPQPKSLKSIKGSIAHELAHIWFLNGEPYENGWLTESFAEYNAMLYIRNTEGAAAFERMIKQKKDRIQAALAQGANPPVVYGAGKKSDFKYTFITLYEKGPVLLSELHQTIGEEKFLVLLKQLASERVSTTGEVISILEKLTNENIAEQFLHKLKSY